MPAAIITAAGKVVQLDARAQPDQQITEREVQDPATLAQLLTSMLADLTAARRAWQPRVLYFRDVVVDATGTTKYPFPHRFAGRVNYEVAAWSGAAAPNLRSDSSTDADTLYLTSTSAGTATIRVEEAG